MCNGCPGGSNISRQSPVPTASLAKDGQLRKSLFSIATLWPEVTVFGMSQIPFSHKNGLRYTGTQSCFGACLTCPSTLGNTGTTVNAVPPPAPAAAEAKRRSKDLSMPGRRWVLQVPTWQTQLRNPRAGGCKGGSRPPCPSSKRDTAQCPKQMMLRTTPGYFFFKVVFFHDPDTNQEGLLARKHLRPWVSPPLEG